MFHRGRAAAIFLLLVSAPATQAQQAASARSIVSRADRIYKAPVSWSEEGIPIGNGRVGTLVWATPRALRLQINRVGDYTGAAVVVDLEFSGDAADVFTADGTTQHLSVYEGLLDVKAAGVNARLLAWHQRDVIAIELDDRRSAAEPIQIKLARDQTAASELAVRFGRVLLTQRFTKGSHPARSSLAVALLGRRTLTRFATDAEVHIVSPAERGRVVILIASAETVDPVEDAVASAFSSLDAAAVKSFDDLAGDNAEWWHAFWQRGTLGLNGPGRTADDLSDYHYKLYLAASIGGMK
jgi:hypothetical protein